VITPAAARENPHSFRMLMGGGKFAPYLMATSFGQSSICTRATS
jgi:hypothetical protein